MIVTCEKCNTGFLVVNSAIPPHGRKVKCSNCGHIWQQYPKRTKETFETQKIEKKQNFSSKKIVNNLPTLRKKEDKISILKVLIVIILFSVTVIFGIIANHRNLPEFADLYQYFGIQDTNSIFIEESSANFNFDINAIDLEIAIRNQSNQVKELHYLKSTVFDEANNKISEYMFELDNRVFGPNEKKQLSFSILNPSKEAKDVALSIGNKWHFLFR